MIRAFALVLLLVSALAHAGEEITLPTERCGDYFFVDVAVSGDTERTLSMLVDTGASHTVVDPDALERVSGQRLRTGKWARFDHVTIGEVKFSDLRARTRELDHLERALTRPLDGILGFPTFKKVLVTFDYANDRLSIEFGELPPADGEQILRLVGEKKRPFIDLYFGKSRRRVLIDTGARGGFALKKPRRLDWMVAPRDAKGTVKINRIEARPMGRLAHDVRVGPRTVTTPTIEVTKGTELVGTEVLAGYALTFDQQNRRVRLHATGDGPIHSQAVRGMAVVMNPTEDGLLVEQVFDNGSAAGAGIRAGDVIIEFDGEPVYERDGCNAMYEERESLRLTITRDGERLILDVPIAEIVP